MIRPDMEPTGLRILVAEDDADTASTMATFLRLHGYEVHLAGDGASTLEAVEDCDPDVLLLDLGLPDMEGYDVARRVKARKALKTPLLIAITARGRDADRERSAAAGIDLHWVKPVDPEQLQGLLTRFQQVIG
jgi:CheY-like chemotaxis protein